MGNRVNLICVYFWLSHNYSGLKVNDFITKYLGFRIITFQFWTFLQQF